MMCYWHSNSTLIPSGNTLLSFRRDKRCTT